MSGINLRNDLSDKQQLAILQEEVGSLSPLLSVYPEEALHKLTKNKSKLQELSNIFNSSMVGVNNTVMIMKCSAEKCPFKVACPLIKMDMAPEGYHCPIEKKIVSEVELSLVSSLSIDTQDTVEMELLYDFIDAKLLDMRTSGMIAEGSVIQHIKKEGRGGDAVLSNEVAPEFTIKMQLKQLKTTILNEFMATRLAKKKHGLNGGSTMEDIIRKAMMYNNNRLENE